MNKGGIYLGIGPTQYVDECCIGHIKYFFYWVQFHF